MREPFQRLFPRLPETARGILEESEHGHGWDHTLRVWHNARHLAEVEEADRAVAEYAAILHDIGRPEETADRGATCHAAAGARRVPAILRGLGITDDAFIEHVTACVRSHRYRGRQRNPPVSLEAKIVYDADKLDSIGAIGIGRAFHFAGHIGARVHNTREEAEGSPAYSRNDSAYREFLVKLRNVHDSMLTGEGKRMAEERHRFMVEFFNRLAREADGEE